MARERHKLAARFVATVIEPGRYGDGGGLFLHVAPTGSRKWVFRYKLHGRAREMGLGSASSVTLAKARERAAEARAELVDRRDPIQQRRATATAQEVVTFRMAAEAHIAAMSPGWSDRTIAGWRWCLLDSGYCKAIADKPVADISVEDVLGVLKPLWRTKPETGSRVRSRMESVLDACRVRGQRTAPNPCSWRGNLAALLPPALKLSRGHHAAMDYREVPAFFARLQEVHNTSSYALQFTILTAARSAETLGATWDEIDLADKLWRIPGARMKAKRPHEVPLSNAALELLEKVRPEGEASGLIFKGARPGRPTASNRHAEKPLSGMAMTQALRRCGGEGATVHGMRSAFRDYVGDETDVARETVEAALAHTVENSTERAYRRSTSLQKRVALMALWSDYVTGKTSGKVVQLASRRPKP